MPARLGGKKALRTRRAAPNASVLIESMRDMGYSLETALADVVDNSLTAGAATVRIFADICGPGARIGILDDGEGMTEADLLTAMRPGSANPRDVRAEADLGRFGLGLKTASFSQCRRVTVVTRRAEKTSAAIWDLDFVAETDDWLVQIPDDIAAIPWANELSDSGTLVIWENLDRLLGDSDAASSVPNFVRRIDDAREHLELVFHRFLSGEPGLPKVRLLLNNRLLEPFDPFHANHPATMRGPIERIKVGQRVVEVQGFTLPHHSKVTTHEWERYAGRDGYLRNQGFYLYRSKRLIIHGTWFGLARQMELTKLCRVRIDMPNGLDAEWKIDVKKSSAQPPHQVRERLRRIIDRFGVGSKRIYTARGRKLTMDSRLPVWLRVRDGDQIVYRLNPEHPVLTALASELPEALRPPFTRLMELIGSTLPMDALFADLGAAPERVCGNTTSDETLRCTVLTTVLRLQEAGVPDTEIVEMLRLAEPFRSNWERTALHLQETSLKELTSDW